MSNNHPSIKRRVFIHQKIPYAFNWNIEHHKLKLSRLNPNYSEFIRLGKYFTRVYKGNIPNNLFNTRSLPRVSKFKISGIKSAFLRSFSKKLIRDGKIDFFNSKTKLPQYAEKVYKNFKDDGINTKPGHGPVLKYILIKDKDSIAIEVPIWRNNKKNVITGHIDLIQIDNTTVKVIDYKPEGNFMISLPQVASYGLLLKSVLDLENVKCISFNRDSAWEYNPSILLKEIKDYLEGNRISKRIWENYF